MPVLSLFYLKGADVVGRPRKFTPEELMAAWGLYKTDCNNQAVLTHEFSAKNSEFISKELRRAVTYTIEGFCVFLDLSRQAFYEYYNSDEAYVDIATRIREECEIDARKKFELGVIPSQLAGLWMSRHGYTTKTEDTLTVTTPTVISGGDTLED